ncbi:MAG: hypothetical protein ABIJ84_00690 [bacterium]
MNTLVSILLAMLSALFFIVLLACDGRLAERQTFGGCILVFVVAFVISRFFSGESPKNKTRKKGEQQR